MASGTEKMGICLFIYMVIYCPFLGIIFGLAIVKGAIGDEFVFETYLNRMLRLQMAAAIVVVSYISFTVQIYRITHI